MTSALLNLRKQAGFKNPKVCAAAEGMATFAGAAIDDSYLDDIRGKDCF